MSYYTVFQPPKPAGHYCIGGSTGFRITITAKPKWLHRKMMLWCLGWEWRDMK